MTSCHVSAPERMVIGAKVTLVTRLSAEARAEWARRTW